MIHIIFFDLHLADDTKSAPLDSHGNSVRPQVCEALYRVSICTFSAEATMFGLTSWPSAISLVFRRAITASFTSNEFSIGVMSAAVFELAGTLTFGTVAICSSSIYADLPMLRGVRRHDYQRFGI